MMLRNRCLRAVRSVGSVVGVRTARGAMARGLSTAASWGDPDSAFSNPEVMEFAKRRQRGVSLRQLVLFGKYGSPEEQEQARRERLISAAQFLYDEIPVRLAHRAVEIASLPYGLATVPGFMKIQRWYTESFREIRALERPVDAATEEAFSRTIEAVYHRHAPTIITAAQGMLQFRSHFQVGLRDRLPGDMDDDVRRFLDRFFASRVGIRLLIEQHLALRQEMPPDYVGIIHTRMSPAQVVEEAVGDARLVVERAFGIAPDVLLAADPAFSFSYIPSHLHHIMFEVVKNAARAVVERHGVIDETGLRVAPDGGLPPVRITISTGPRNEDVVCRVSDEGGGIPRSDLRSVWSYLYTTFSLDGAPAVEDLINAGNAPDFGTSVPVAGLGVGLPISRILARYFGGDLRLVSMEGHGCDAYLWLRRTGDADEPVFHCGVPLAGHHQPSQFATGPLESDGLPDDGYYVRS